MEPGGLGLSTCQRLSARAQDLPFQVGRSFTSLCCTLLNSGLELCPSDLAGALVLDFCEDQVNVCLGAGLIHNLTVNSEFGEGLSVNLFCTCGEFIEDSLEGGSSATTTTFRFFLCSSWLACSLLWSRLLLFFENNSSNLVSHLGDASSSFDTANVGLRSIKRLADIVNCPIASC